MTQIRKQLQDYIETADDKKLKAIYTLVEDELPYTGKLSKEQLAELDRRLAKHDNGLSKLYSWDDAQKILDEALTKA